MSDSAVYYRLDDRRVSAGVDEFDNPIGGSDRIQVDISTYRVVRKTPKGVWVQAYGDRKFVLERARKKFACPTPEEAKESFLARKRRQLRILHKQVRNVEIAITLADDAVERFNNYRDGGFIIL